MTEKMIRKLRAGMMPPPARGGPRRRVLVELAAALETRIDRGGRAQSQSRDSVRSSAPIAPNTRARCAICWASTSTSTPFLPPDTISNGFDNVADVQSLSPTLMEGYLRAAEPDQPPGRRRSHGATATSVTYKIPRARSRRWRTSRARPIGTRGGVSEMHVFPADGEYVFKAALHYEPLGGLVGRATMSMFDLKEQIEVSIDGERVGACSI